MITGRTPFINKIHDLKIPKSDLAALAGVNPTRVSEYVRNRHVPSAKAVAIERAVDDIARVWGLLAPFRIDTANTELFKRALLEIDAALAGLAAAKALEFETVRNTGSAGGIVTNNLTRVLDDTRAEQNDLTNGRHSPE